MLLFLLIHPQLFLSVVLWWVTRLLSWVQILVSGDAINIYVKHTAVLVFWCLLPLCCLHSYLQKENVVFIFPPLDHKPLLGVDLQLAKQHQRPPTKASFRGRGRNPCLPYGVIHRRDCLFFDVCDQICHYVTLSGQTSVPHWKNKHAFWELQPASAALT